MKLSNTHHIPRSLDGRGIKEPVPVLDTGSEGETRQHHPRPVDSRLRGNDGPAPVILALRQYPQGGETPIQHSVPSTAKAKSSPSMPIHKHPC